MANEVTPLIRAVRVQPRRRPQSRSVCRRFCSLASSCALIFVLGWFVFHTFYAWPSHAHHGGHGRHAAAHTGGHKRPSHDELEALFLETPSTEKIEEWLRYYTAGPHLAGKNLSQAEWTKDLWENWGVESTIAAYDCYINYPDEVSLSLLKKSGEEDSWGVDYKALLDEPVIDEDPTTALEDRIPIFHGYSANGNVTASYVYVNYGTYQDYQDLVDAGIELEGKIALVRYGGVFRGLKVKRAQDLGMIGTVIYSDPGDDGSITEENGYDYYPNGPARHPDSVQRGSVQFISVRPGDPTTPGYPSKPGVPRAPPTDSTPTIPSIPISYNDALPLLKALNGVGPKASDFGGAWTRHNGLGYKGVEYNIGPSPDGVALNLYNNVEYTITPQWDVIGIINGTVPNDVIIVGNHRDAWIAGGAGDPNSGSAVLNEVVRTLSKAVEQGWQPLRTIVFASWDGEEYGLVGSTEWVEEYLPWIQDANVAYLNVDIAVDGTTFAPTSSPILNRVLRDAFYKVPSPNQTVPGQTVGDLWNGWIGFLGSGSDFTAFLDHAGVPSLNLGFGNAGDEPVYHYHSNYDSFHWMEKYGDPGFKYHVAVAQLFNVITLDLVDSLVIPFTATEYADELDKYLDQIEAKLEPDLIAASDADIVRSRTSMSPGEVTGSSDAFKESLVAVRRALAQLRIKALELDEVAAWADEQLREGIPWWNIVKKIKLGYAIVKSNKKYKYLERNFLFEGGLDGRAWYRHVVYAPGLWTGYDGDVYPGLSESIDARDYSNGLKWAGIIESAVTKAAKSLE